MSSIKFRDSSDVLGLKGQTKAYWTGFAKFLGFAKTDNAPEYIGLDMVDVKRRRHSKLRFSLGSPPAEYAACMEAISETSDVKRTWFNSHSGEWVNGTFTIDGTARWKAGTKPVGNIDAGGFNCILEYDKVWWGDGPRHVTIDGIAVPGQFVPFSLADGDHAIRFDGDNRVDVYVHYIPRIAQ
jgi:hypothetical protein